MSLETQAGVGSTGTERQLRFAFLEACRLRLFQRPDVDFVFGRMAGRRGVRNLRRLIAAWVPELNRTRSVLEGLFLLAWVASGGPAPQVNVKVAGYDEVDPDPAILIHTLKRAMEGPKLQKFVA